MSLTFGFNLVANPAGYNLSAIQTYAGWDSGRDGQQYTVEYSTASAPGTFLALASASRFDNTVFPLTAPVYDDNGDPIPGIFVENTDHSATLVQLAADSGFLAENVAALRFNFSGVENSGTAYREFVIQGAGAAVPEPTATLLGTLGLLTSGLLLRRRTERSR